MRIFITGVAGFLGSHTAEAFIKDGHEVLGIDDLSGGDLQNVPDGVHFRQATCLDRSAYKNDLLGVDVVYHCAASAYDGLSVFSPSFVFRDTAQASVEVATAAVEAGVRRYVYCSSMARYGLGDSPFREDALARPVTPYGIAKLAAEDVTRSLFDAHGGEWVVAVPHNIIGPRQKHNDPYRNVAAIMMNRMLLGQQPVIYGDGSHRRCFTFVDDAVSTLKRMATEPAAAGEIVNIGPDEETITILGLAEIISDLMGFALNPIFVPDRLLEVANATCSSDKAREILGYRTEMPLRDGLESMLKWMMARGPSPFEYNRPIEIETSQTPLTWSDRLI